MVVETPDSIFVSDLDHSRDVKSIVARLKEKGRKEYHQHRTIHYPWGSRTWLEQKQDFTVARLKIYPNSSLQMDLEASTVMHLIVVKGSTLVAVNGRVLTLNSGMPTTITEKGLVRVENKGDQAVLLIQIVSQDDN